MLIAGCDHRLSARLDPVRAAGEPARRPRRHQANRLGQYRRHQRVAHRQQGAGGADLGARHRQGLGGGGNRAPLGRAVGAGGGLGAVLGHMFPVWLGFRGGKGVATALGVLIGLAWPVALAALADLARGGRCEPLFVAGGAGRGRGQRRDSSISGRRCDSDPDRRVGALDHPAPSRQHPASDRGPRAPDFVPERLRRALAARDLDPEERLDWLRLSRTESIGPITFYAMLRRFGSARAALEALPRLARRGERARTVTAATRAAAEAELTRAPPHAAAGSCAGASPAIPAPWPRSRMRRRS